MNLDAVQRKALESLQPLLMPLIKALARSADPPANPLSQHVHDTIEACEIEDELGLKPVIIALVVEHTNEHPDQVRELIDQLGRYE